MVSYKDVELALFGVRARTGKDVKMFGSGRAGRYIFVVKRTNVAPPRFDTGYREFEFKGDDFGSETELSKWLLERVREVQ